ncbi:MAG: imelysin family protein [Burkholderiales bacterium]|nr:imelysin family protein [Burkholderiales bacterium]
MRRARRLIGIACFAGVALTGPLALAQGSAAGSAPTQAGADRGVSAVPFYSSADLAQGVYRYWHLPQAEAFAARAADLAQALADHCPRAQPGERPPAELQQRWRAAAQVWDRLTGVLVGPLVERRVLHQLDFTPTRPELIERAIRSAPADAQAMERIGTPAKGLPALEWLLWSRPERLGKGPDAPACRYAVQVAAELAREAVSLREGFAAAAPAGETSEDEPDAPAQAATAMSELVNQFVGGIERLRWLNIEKPLRSAAPGKPPAFPRMAAGATAQAWAAQWEALRTLAVAPAGVAAPQPGTGLITIEHFLRGWGRHELADKLRRSIPAVDQRMRGLAPASPRQRLLDASRELSAFKRLIEAEVAPAMKINIGFSDADGD